MGSTRDTVTRRRLTLLDRMAARRNGLRDPRPYARRSIRIPLRDGVELGADVFTPSGTSKGDVVLHGPYGRSAFFATSAAGIFAAQGYTVLLASTRGTADSGGVLDPMRHDAADGHDIVAWLREQPWYGGRFATVGASYLGYTQWAILADPEPDHVAAVVTCGPHDFAAQGWGSGTARLDLLAWTDQMVLQARHGLVRNLMALASAPRRLRPVLDAVPFADAAVALLGEGAPWLEVRLRHPDLSDPYWSPMRQGDALERATIPVLIQAGWQDIFLDQSLEQFARLHHRAQQVALTVGPWAHLDLVRGAPRVITPEMVAWLDEHLAGHASTARPSPVRVYVTGSDVVRNLATWPPDATWRVLHLHPAGRLSDALPRADAPTMSFRYDPANPTPTVGGPMITDGGYVDDTALAKRSDVLVWTGPPLGHDLTVVGVPRVELDHTTERPDADVFVRLSDVDHGGCSRNVTERYARVRHDAHAPLVLDLRGTAHTFRAGHRVRVMVAGGSFPQYPRNPGTGENPLTARVLHTNRHTVRVAGGVSRVRLPVV